MFLQSIERFIDFDFNRDISSLEHYFLPYLENAEYKESFLTEQALLSKRAKHGDV